jgi:hypothetical protein
MTTEQKIIRAKAGPPDGWCRDRVRVADQCGQQEPRRGRRMDRIGVIDHPEQTTGVVRSIDVSISRGYPGETSQSASPSLSLAPVPC